MKQSFVFLLITLLLAGCATQKAQVKVPRSTPVVSKKVIETHGVLWELLNTEGKIKVFLLNLDNQKEAQIDLENGPQTYEISEGTWQIMAFVLKAKRYDTLLSSQNFVFKAVKGKTVYAGSLVFQCPRVGSKYNSLLKSHKYFNRYPFKNQKGLCELIVGNDFANIQKILSKSRKSSLILGL